MAGARTVNSFENGNNFHVMCLGKRIDDNESRESQLAQAPGKIASQGGRITRHVDDTCRSALAHCV